MAAKRLAARLKVGGVLVVLDFETHGHSPSGPHSHAGSHGHSGSHVHGHGEEEKQKEVDFTSFNASSFDHAAAQHTITHHGFSEEDIRTMVCLSLSLSPSISLYTRKRYSYIPLKITTYLIYIHIHIPIRNPSPSQFLSLSVKS